MPFKKVLAFAFLITLAMQTLDIIGHLTPIVWNGELIKGETAVHLPYIAVKMTVIFFSLLAFTYFLGASKKKAWLGAFTATAIFDIYYRFAEATLDRTVYTLDEKRISWIVFHAICILVPYWLITKFLLEKQVWDGVMYPNIAKARTRLTAISLISLVGAGLFLLPTKSYLKANDLISREFTFDDHIMTGTLFFIVAVHTFYKLATIAQIDE